MNNTEKLITMAHGSGGAGSAELMQSVFSKHFNNEILGRLEDSAIVGEMTERLAISTDSFVVSPFIFPGGDIGKLAVCGTVNDVLMSGAAPRYLTCGFVLETGLSIELLDRICASLAAEANQAGVMIIAGDTKVIEGHGEAGGLIINTTGIGVFDQPLRGSELRAARNDSNEAMRSPYPSPAGIRPGDAIIVSGDLGDHHAAILSARMGIKNNIQSDCALLTPIIHALNEAEIEVHAMRDVTRGGLATVLNELAAASGVSIEIEEEKIPVKPEVRAFCGIMGLDPLYMGNEGKVALAVSPVDAERALTAVRGTEIGRNAAIIGKAEKGSEPSPCFVLMRTRIGGIVRLDVLYGEGLPRIC